MITCRRATIEDVALFRRIRLAALTDSPDAYGSTYDAALKRDFSSWEEQLCSTVSGDIRNTQFAFDGNECVGIAALYREPCAPIGDIIMMWVDPRARGTIAASTLVAELIFWANKSGIESVALVVTDTNSRAIKFYENQGFAATGEVVDVDVNRNLRGVRMKIKTG